MLNLRILVRIQEFNAHIFLSSLAPYHETPQFARAVQISDLARAPLLATFLQPYKDQLKALGGQEGAQLPPLPSTSIITTLTRNPSSPQAKQLLEWVAGLVSPKADAAEENLAPHRALIAFWTSTLIQFCVLSSGQPASGRTQFFAPDGGRTTTSLLKPADAQACVALLLPSATGLAARANAVAAAADSFTKKKRKSKGQKGWSEARVAGCMLICAIAGCFDLSAAAASATLKEFLPAPKEDAGEAQSTRSDDAFLLQTRACLAACYAICASVSTEASASKVINKSILASLLSLPSLSKNLEQDMQKSDISAFLREFLVGCAECLDEKKDALATRAREALEPLLISEHLSESVQQHTADILAGLPLPADPAQILAQQPARIALLSSLRQRYPNCFDAALETLEDDSAPSASGLRRKGKNKTTASSGAQQPAGVLLQAVIAQSNLNGLHVAPTNASAAREYIDEQMWLALHSSQKAEREVALQSIMKDFTLQTASAEEKRSMKALLLGRISDDSPSLLAKLYAGGKQSLLCQLATADEILASIEKVVQRIPDVADKVTKAHQSFALNEVLHLPHSLRASERVFKRIIFPALFSTDKTEEIVYGTLDALRKAKLPQQAKGVWTTLLMLVKGVAEKKWQDVVVVIDTNNDMRNVLGGFVAQLKEAGQLEEALAFLVEQAPQVTYSGAMALACLASFIPVDPRSKEKRASLWRFLYPMAVERLKQSPPTFKFLNYVGKYFEGLTPELMQRLGEITFYSLAKSLPGDVDLDLSEQYFIGDDSPAAKAVDDVFETLTSGLLDADTQVEFANELFSSIPHAIHARLAHIFTNPRASSQARFLALNLFNHMLPRIGIDCQTLLPALLQMLAHPQESLRTVAMACLSTMRGVTQSLKQDQIYGFDSIYGPISSKLQYLRFDDFSRLVDRVSVRDPPVTAPGPEYLAELLAEQLTPSKSDDRSLASFKTAASCYLLSHVACWPTSHGKAVLLSALAPIKTTAKMQILLEPLQELIRDLEGTTSQIDDDALKCLKLMFSIYDRNARGSLEETSLAWKVLLTGIRSQNGKCRA